MKNKTIYFILLFVIVLSCKKESEIDPGTEGLNKLPKGTDSIQYDTTGIHPFLGEKYLVISRKEQRMLYYAKESNIYSIKAIALPESDNSSKELFPKEIQQVMFDCRSSNFFFGYPSVINLNGNPLVVAERRASEKFVNSFSDDFFLTQDADSTWIQTDFFKYAPYGNQFINSKPMIGKTEDGIIVVKGKGLLISNGDIQNWSHYPHAFDSLLSKPYEECSPAFTYSSKFGMFFGTAQYIDKVVTHYGAIISIDITNGVAKEVISKWVPKVQKFDGTYKDMMLLSTPTFYSVEHPDLSANNGDVIAFGTVNDVVYQFVYNYKAGDTFDSIKFKVALTNIKGSVVRQSPPTIDYNPVTQRFEMAHSSPYYLHIYSIAPGDLLSNKVNIYGTAEWTNEALLLDRDLSVRGQGMHPVGSIIDTQNGIQKIYIQAGAEYPGRSGIFEITRILNTNELSQFVSARRKILDLQKY